LMDVAARDHRCRPPCLGHLHLLGQRARQRGTWRRRRMPRPSPRPPCRGVQRTKRPCSRAPSAAGHGP
jgi:hypothetical protein